MKLKMNPMRLTRHISFLLLLVFLSSCSRQTYNVQRTDYAANRFITENIAEDPSANQIILPYKENLDGEMNRVISYTPIDLHKDGFNSPLANLNCDLILEESNLIFEKRHQRKIDICLLNHGGIRRTFTKGDLTVRNIYEWMPFENEALVVTLRGDQILKMVEYLSNSGKGHPISGMKFKVNDENSIEINGEKFDRNKTYTVVTNDYLQKGGDEMYFFADPVEMEFLNLKLRDMMLQYFEKHDTIRVNLDQRLIQ